MAVKARSVRRSPTGASVRHQGDVAFEIRDQIAPGSRCSPTNLLIALPERLGGGSQESKMTGSFAASFRDDGTFLIYSLDARISSFQLPLPGNRKGEYHWIETGQLQLGLADLPIPAFRPFGELNSGAIDYKTGAVRMTWAATVQSPRLWRLEIGPVPVFFQESGFFDAETGGFRLSGSGLLLSPLFTGVVILAINTPAPVTTLAVSLPTPVVNGVNTVRITRTPAPTPAAPLTVTLSGFNTDVAGAIGTLAIVTPVVMTAGTATTTLTLTGVRRGSRVRVNASGGGDTAFDDALVGV